MKLCILVCLAAIVAVSVGEMCPSGNVADCINTNCADHFHTDCVQGVCTCTHDAYCDTQAMCLNSGRDCNRPGGWHCVDNRCRCGGNFG